VTYIECRFWRILYETRAIGLVGAGFGARCAGDGRPVVHVAVVQADPTDGYDLPARDTAALQSLPARIFEHSLEPGAWDEPHAWVKTVNPRLSCEPSPTIFKLSRARKFGDLIERFYFATIVPELDGLRPAPPAVWARGAPLIAIVPAPVLKKGSRHA